MTDSDKEADPIKINLFLKKNKEKPSSELRLEEKGQVLWSNKGFHFCLCARVITLFEISVEDFEVPP